MSAVRMERLTTAAELHLMTNGNREYKLNMKTANPISKKTASTFQLNVVSSSRSKMSLEKKQK